MVATSGSLTLKRRRTGERVIKGALLACGVVSIATTIGIVLSLLFETVEFFRRVPILDFLTGTKWAPTFKPASFGVLPLVTATLLIAGIASLVAFPLGLGAAVYLSEYASPRARKILKPILEVLAGIPTVVLGYFALTYVTPTILRRIVPWVDGAPLGPFNALSAGIVVGIAIVPIIASLSEDAMRAVPSSLREAGYGIGSTRRTVATKVVVPAALSGIASAFILGLSRAIGETMIVAIAAGGNPNLSADPRQSMETMTAFIVRVSQGDTPTTSIAYKTIFALGMTLFLMTLVLNLIATRVVRRFRERYD
jgi:phosphate transport system permease protein